jgi:hypothetical protein
VRTARRTIAAKEEGALKIDHSFPLQILATLAGAGALAAYPLARYGSAEIVVATVAGALLSTVNVLLGFLAIEYAFEKSYTVFLIFVLGGMGARMILIMGTLVLLILVVHLDATALVVSVLAFFVFFLILEILFIQRKVGNRNTSS